MTISGFRIAILKPERAILAHAPSMVGRRRLRRYYIIMNPWRSLGELPRQMWVLFAATLINRAGTMALPFLVLYLTENRGFTAGRAGLAVAVYGIGSLITAPVSGRLCDRVGAVKIMKWSLISSGALLFTFPLLRSFASILGLTLAWGVISEAFRPASLSIIAALVEPRQRKSAFALSRLAINLGMSVGPAVGGFLAMVSFASLFIVDGATSILAGVVIAASRLGDALHGSAESAAGSDPSHRLAEASPIKDRRLLYFLLSLVPVIMVFFQPHAAMAVYLVRDLNMAESVYGMLLAINTVLIILIEVPLNAAMAGWPDRRQLVLGSVLVGLGFGALALARDFVGIAATVVIWTFGEMIMLPSSSSYMADISPERRRGEYMGFYQMTWGVAFALGPWLGAQMLERLGAAALWAACFACGTLSAALMTRLERPKAERQEAKA